MSVLSLSFRGHHFADEVALISGARVWSRNFNGVSVAVSRLDSAHLWAPADDPSDHLAVFLAGRIALSERQWRAAEALPYDGGLAGRHVLELYRQCGIQFSEHLNGAFTAVIVDPARRTVHIATDRMGFAPVFGWSLADRPIISTHPDLVGRAASGSTVDVLSLAEVVAYGRASFPYTYFSGVECLPPGHVFSWENGRHKKWRYWAPRYQPPQKPKVAAFGDALASALSEAVALRTTPRLGPTGVLLSGGADSRAVLYATHSPPDVTSITLYSEPNAELAIARALAERVGSRHVALRRDFEHYGIGAREAVRITGGMWNLLDAHYTQLGDEIRVCATGTLLTGCHADYLFKGLTSDRRHRRIAGRAVPLYRFAPYNEAWYVPPGSANPALAAAISERRHQRMAGLDLTDGSDASRWEIERRRILPLAYEPDTAGRMLLLRALRWDPIFADNRLIELWQRIPPSLKLNAAVWEAAVRQICTGAGDILNNNSQSRIGAPVPLKLATFFHGVMYRKLFKRDLDGTPLGSFAGRGSWPDFSHYYRHSRVVPALWNEPSPLVAELLKQVLGVDPWATPLQAWARQPHVFSRVLTVKLWLDQTLSRPSVSATRGDPDTHEAV